MELVKWAWLQAGFIGLFLILATVVLIVAWKIINVLWEDNKLLRGMLRDADLRISVVAETSRVAIEKMQGTAVETNNLIRTFITKSLS